MSDTDIWKEADELLNLARQLERELAAMTQRAETAEDNLAFEQLHNVALTKRAEKAEAAVAALTRERDEAREVLKVVEWIEGEMIERFCPCCGCGEKTGHAPDCRLKEILK